jgi:hypothetical protein
MAMRNHTQAALGVSALLGWVCSGGCGSNHGGFVVDAASPIDASSGDDVGQFGDGGDGAACTCSADLHQVICQGQVTQTCGADQGCAGGTCVSACDAAKANQSSVGCDYFTYDPDAYTGDNLAGGCFAAYVANTWGSPVDITVDYGGKPLTDYAGFMRVTSGSGQSITYTPLKGNTLPPGQVALLFLASTPKSKIQCPSGITPAYTTADAATRGTGIGTAFHITTDRPVVAYDIYPYGGGDSAITAATLLIPTTAWDTNYVAVDGYKGSLSGFSAWVSVVAQADGTNVTISPTSAIAGAGAVTGTGKGVPHTWTLDRGQVLQLEQADGTELNGSPIQADKPVGVFGGTTCMDVPTNVTACDSAHQQIPPVHALGHEYAYARYRDRSQVPEAPPVRIVGAVDGTTLSYDPGTPTGAPTALAAGQMVEFDPGTPFTIKSQGSQHPFYMAEYMTGGSPYGGAGDPEFVNVVPPEEYLAQYTFFTDPTYPETELVVVRKKNQAGAYDDVILDCLGGPVTGWQPVDTSGSEYARVDLVTGNFTKVGNCDNGFHQMHSATPFGLTVWGWGSCATSNCYMTGPPGFNSTYVSYAYPAGMSVQPITTVVVLPLPR